MVVPSRSEEREGSEENEGAHLDWSGGGGWGLLSRSWGLNEGGSLLIVEDRLLWQKTRWITKGHPGLD